MTMLDKSTPNTPSNPARRTHEQRMEMLWSIYSADKASKKYRLANKPAVYLQATTVALGYDEQGAIALGYDERVVGFTMTQAEGKIGGAIANHLQTLLADGICYMRDLITFAHVLERLALQTIEDGAKCSCSECGSTDVYMRAIVWVPINTEGDDEMTDATVGDSCPDFEKGSRIWCGVCEMEVGVHNHPYSD